MEENTKKIMLWASRMQMVYGNAPGGYDWCRAIAYYVDEAGNDSPSNEAIKTALSLEKDPSPLFEYWDAG
jgi:hypothetical protein